MDWDFHAKAPNNFYNTPNVFALYLSNLVLRNTKKFGIEHYDDLAKQRSNLIYDTIDSSNGFYTSKTDPAHRSRLNLMYNLPTKELEQEYLAKAKEEGLMWMGGHALFGGCRASMYNGMPLEGAIKLQQFMKKF